MDADKYLQFLCGIVGCEFGRERRNCTDANDYGMLLTYLHSLEFYSTIPYDDNRGEDGKRLRYIFLDEIEETLSRRGRHGLSTLSILTEKIEDMGPCTVLEMLIGVAFRMENELAGGIEALSVSEAFWVLIDNLDLKWCRNGELLSSLELVRKQVEDFLDRKYSKNGLGGLFPLRKSNEDQRNIEIWYQMQKYLLENFDF